MRAPTLDVRELQFRGLVSIVSPPRARGAQRLVLSKLKALVVAPGGLVSVGIGAKLRTIRQQWRLSLREVEERSLRFAQEQGDQSYQVSASWLVRLEREDHELTVNKLIALADIYNIPAEELLRSTYPRSPQPMLRERSTPNVTMLLTEGPLEQQARYMLTEPPDAEQLPDETVLLPMGGGVSQAPYKRGLIGKRDRTLEPMIRPGTIVHIDTQKRSISLRKDW